MVFLDEAREALREGSEEGLVLGEDLVYFWDCALASKVDGCSPTDDAVVE